jgi:hypothetical protein
MISSFDPVSTIMEEKSPGNQPDMGYTVPKDWSGSVSIERKTLFSLGIYLAHYVRRREREVDTALTDGISIPQMLLISFELKPSTSPEAGPGAGKPLDFVELIANQ